jgi:hypothetical protein
MRLWKKLLKLEWLYVIAAACVAVYLLFTGRFIGVADNGDFLRIMGSAGLNYGIASESYEDRFFGFSHIHFAYDQLLTRQRSIFASLAAYMRCFSWLRVIC